jgi:hypothetical protein
MAWTKKTNDDFTFINQEKNEDGSYTYIDEWRFTR